MNIELCRKTLLSDSNNDNDSTSDDSSPTPLQKEYKRQMLSSLCNVPLDNLDENAKPKGLLFGSADNHSTGNKLRVEDPYSLDHLRVLQQFEKAGVAKGSGVVKNQWRIPSKPERILDIPMFKDDYYLNLISWSADNIIAIGLDRSVYLWNDSTKKGERLTTLEGSRCHVTSVAWCTRPGQSKYLAIGTNSGRVEIWDTQVICRIRTLTGHYDRVSSMAWNDYWLSTGSRDSRICLHDLRAGEHLAHVCLTHFFEVCGLSWDEEGSSLASAGKDGYVYIWDSAMFSRRQPNRLGHSANPRLALEHSNLSSVKALGWCPFRRGLLATGGGQADQTIKLWETNRGQLLNSTHTGSQVSAVIWSNHGRELCSSHGYYEHQLSLWKFGQGSSLTKVRDLESHQRGILSMVRSPDGSTVVSASADESLQFWNVFGPSPNTRKSRRRPVVMPIGELTFGMPTIR